MKTRQLVLPYTSSTDNLRSVLIHLAYLCVEIDHVVVLHLEAQPWGMQEFISALKPEAGMHGFVNIHPYTTDSCKLLEFAIRVLGFEGLKLHPRLQQFDVSSKLVVNLCNKAADLGVPVLIDAFPDGTYLMNGFNPIDYALLAKRCDMTKFIWAHMGGHYVIDFMMLAKRLSNVWMDTSYSLLYYRGSSKVDDFTYAMKSMRFNRILYGSDYPDRPLKETLHESIEILTQHGIIDSAADSILSKNAYALFGWSKA